LRGGKEGLSGYKPCLELAPPSSRCTRLVNLYLVFGVVTERLSSHRPSQCGGLSSLIASSSPHCLHVDDFRTGNRPLHVPTAHLPNLALRDWSKDISPTSDLTASEGYFVSKFLFTLHRSPNFHTNMQIIHQRTLIIPITG
jgi:hypothetical protein